MGIEFRQENGGKGENLNRKSIMKLKVVVHTAEEGGFWAEVPSIAGCATQGDDYEELIQNLYEAIEGCLMTSQA